MGWFDSGEVKFLRKLVEDLRKDNAALSARIGLLADPLVLARQAGAERAMASTEAAREQAKAAPREPDPPAGPRKLQGPAHFRRTAQRPDPAMDLTPRPKLTPEEEALKHTVYGA